MNYNMLSNVDYSTGLLNSYRSCIAVLETNIKINSQAYNFEYRYQTCDFDYEY